MINIIQSELLKYRRTSIKKIIFLAPLFYILIALPQNLFMPTDYFRSWQILLYQVYNWWPVIFVPLGVSLFAALVGLQEKKAGNYRSIYLCSVLPSSIWLGKVIVMAIHLLLTTLGLITSIIILGLMTADGNIPWLKIFTGGFTIWVVSLTLIPLQLWMATWKGIFGSLALGFLGMILGVMAAPEAYWVYVPWSWPIRLMCPIIGVHPNGIPLSSSDSLMNPSVIPKGILLAIVSLIIFTIATAMWFNRREVI